MKKEDGFSPLLLASLNGHVPCVKLLLDEGRALPEIADNRGQTALHSAVHQGHAAVVETILSRYDASTCKRLINKDDVEGETSLHIALSREGEPPVPLSADTAPLTLELADKAEKFGVPRKLVHAIAIATFLVVKGGKLTPKNRRGHTPIDHVFDPLAKAFLLDTVAQLKPAKQQSTPAANAQNLLRVIASRNIRALRSPNRLRRLLQTNEKMHRMRNSHFKQNLPELAKRFWPKIGSTFTRSGGQSPRFGGPVPLLHLHGTEQDHRVPVWSWSLFTLLRDPEYLPHVQISHHKENFLVLT